jgi:hypothetical protein
MLYSRFRSAHGRLTISSRSDHGQLTLSLRLGRDQITFRKILRLSLNASVHMNDHVNVTGHLCGCTYSSTAVSQTSLPVDPFWLRKITTVPYTLARINIKVPG